MPIWKGNNPILRGRKLTMVINHYLNGMILQVRSRDNWTGGFPNSLPMVFSLLHSRMGFLEICSPINTQYIIRISHRGPTLRFGVHPTNSPKNRGQKAARLLFGGGRPWKMNHVGEPKSWRCMVKFDENSRISIG